MGLALGLLGLGTQAASAFPVLPKPVLQADATTGNIVDVRHVGGGYHGNSHGFYPPGYRAGMRPGYRPNSWNYGYHGPRCRSWSNSCRFYYGGWYYNNPWWTVPVIGAGAVALSNSSGSRHRAWCAGRYKSYNAQTNTYVSSNGKRKQCNSPYD
jgi:hypothetical protein